MFGWFNTKKSKALKELNGQLTKSSDYKKFEYINQKTNLPFQLTYIKSIVDEKKIHDHILPFLLEQPLWSLKDIKKILPISEVEFSNEITLLEEKILSGNIILTLGSNQKDYASISVQKHIGRGVTPPEIEFSVIGPKESFVESLAQNLNLIRKRIPIKELMINELTIGKLSKTKVAILHIEGVADEENVRTVKQRIKDLEFDLITDSAYLVQLVSDNQNSPFPQMLDTERPDRIAAILAEGKIAIIVDGSPHVLITPTTFIEFFSSFEDYLLNWVLASFFRLIRLFSVAFSIFITPVYVATLSYHYELIPKDLMITLVSSRRLIPFPPIIEALILELTIELLREAGARLPTKVGQTIGIVGGIVIGTASVEAGLTSNVLLIFVALAALASFTTPVYKMGNTIRLMRFPFLLFAELWGLIGVVFCFCLVLTHLIRLTSLGRPFLEPIYPPRVADFRDAFVRLPFSQLSLRPSYLRTGKPERFSKEKASEKKDIDE